MLTEEGWTAVVRVVQYLSESEVVGPEFVLDLELIALRDRVGAFFEADPYVWQQLARPRGSGPLGRASVNSWFGISRRCRQPSVGVVVGSTRAGTTVERTGR